MKLFNFRREDLSPISVLASTKEEAEQKLRESLNIPEDEKLTPFTLSVFKRS